MLKERWRTPTIWSVLYVTSSLIATAGVGVILAATDSRNGLMPHAYCLAASPYLAMIRGAVDVSIWLAYFAMAIVLVRIYQFRHDRRARRIWSRSSKTDSYILVLWFAAFIFSCGMTHLFNFITLYKAYYFLDTMWMCITSATSWGTVYLVVKNRGRLGSMMNVLHGEDDNYDD